MAHRSRVQTLAAGGVPRALVRVLLVLGLSAGLVLMHTVGHPGGHHGTGWSVSGGWTDDSAGHPSGYADLGALSGEADRDHIGHSLAPAGSHPAPDTEPGCDPVMSCVAVLTLAGVGLLALVLLAVVTVTVRPRRFPGPGVRRTVAAPMWCHPSPVVLSILRT